MGIFDKKETKQQPKTFFDIIKENQKKAEQVKKEQKAPVFPFNTPNVVKAQPKKEEKKEIVITDADRVKKLIAFTGVSIADVDKAIKEDKNIEDIVGKKVLLIKK